VPPVGLGCASHTAAGETLALVSLAGVGGVVVRDITDINHPATRCTFAGGSYFKFYNATHVSYIVAASGNLGAAGALYLASLATGTTSLVRAWSYGGYESWVYAWSPDGRELTYISSDTGGAQWHILSAAGDRMLLNLGQIVPRDVNTDNDDAWVGFSADGKYVAVEQTFTQGKGATSTAPPIQINSVSDGRDAYSGTDGTMAAWGGVGAHLYFRTNAGVQMWSPSGSVATVAAGVSWIHPWPSADGSRIAFSVLNAQTNHVAEVLDLTSGATHQLSPTPRVGAAFLDASLVWYSGETICTTATPCGLGGPPLTGTTYIYDLGSDVENGSIETAFYDSWPHVTGQS
jgi:dipeptidyl aminopeptidase/acylaminoacyl peptidase